MIEGLTMNAKCGATRGKSSTVLTAQDRLRRKLLR